MDWLLKHVYTLPNPSLTRDRSMEVLALGLGRSGTDSLKRALEILGYHDVYHGFYAVDPAHCNDNVDWVKLAKAKIHANGTLGPASSIIPNDCKTITTADFDKMLGHCSAVTDMPCAAFAPELLRCYPEAKVILNYREDVDGWHRSLLSTLDKLYRKSLRGRFSWWCSVFEGELFWSRQMWHDVLLGYFDFDTENNGKAYYVRHYANLEQTLEQRRTPYLRWTAQEGWKPLCDFLGKDIPGVPFPSGNVAGDVDARRASIHAGRYKRAHHRMAITAGSTLAVAAVFWVRFSRFAILSWISDRWTRVIG